MNKKQKKQQINKIFLPLVMALCSVCLLLPDVPAKAGPTTGQLQQQIDRLTAQVNRIRPLIEDPNNKTYFAGLASFSQFEDCLKVDQNLECQQIALILVDVLEGQPIDLELNTSQPQPTELNITKVPSENPLSNRDYKVNVKATYHVDTFSFDVSPDHPFYSSNYDSSYPGTMLPIKCELVTDWRIKIIMKAESVSQIRAEGLSVIDDTHIEPYTESATETELKVTVTNNGDYTANYIVTATGFGPSIEPVIPGYVTLPSYGQPGNSATLTLPIRTVDTFAGQGPCLVTVSSDFGKKYAQTTADFPAPLPDPPPPEYIPDFDGDGDCDFGDFGYFSLHWLEQPDT
ncbi:MAG: hypothetical protein GWN67_00795 [Phycisphaerae bacterium]|nr:hypothetical protein [Phycisphaerae bacterium]NIP50816.1 hypothetical protein [Phycisphaerae bacterium]NIS52909.1 hypothetical protein [Phycisphaerae bacterium]NIU10391.1 hypothetical protein [Phycisphaerae bacterium]NIU54974.1 hypothetical protein [Phycisphaerae bacterium]